MVPQYSATEPQVSNVYILPYVSDARFFTLMIAVDGTVETSVLEINILDHGQTTREWIDGF